jgi:hypothetical protein
MNDLVITPPTHTKQRFLESIVALVRRDAYGRGFQGKKRYEYVEEDGEIDAKLLRDHLSGVQPIGVFPILPGGDTTSILIFDLDDKKDIVPWDEMRRIGLMVAAELRLVGINAFGFRSGGGRGIHLWCLWDKPQSAKLLRVVATRVLERIGFKIGSKSVDEKQIDLYPGENVDDDGYGKLIALPFSRRSVMLDDDLQPIRRHAPLVYQRAARGPGGTRSVAGKGTPVDRVGGAEGGVKRPSGQ